MADKYLIADVDGTIKERNPATQSSGSSDAGEIVALNDYGVIDPSMLPPEALGEVVTVTAGEQLHAGDMVYIYDDNGTKKCRRAQANDPDTLADGFVKQDYVDGATDVKVFFEGTFTKAGVTFNTGRAYFLSKDTPGDITDDVSAYTGGSCVQRIGTAISPTEIQFERSIPIIKHASDVDGGNANSNPPSAYDGGDANSNANNFIDGGSATD